MSRYIAMNRFRVVKGHESEFEEIWKTRNTYLDGSPGFIEFNLLRGPEREDHVLYASHTLWESEAAFEDWTNSEAFRQAHAGAGKRGHLYLGHPDFEGFETIDGASVTKDGEKISDSASIENRWSLPTSVQDSLESG